MSGPGMEYWPGRHHRRRLQHLPRDTAGRGPAAVPGTAQRAVGLRHLRRGDRPDPGPHVPPRGLTRQLGSHPLGHVTPHPRRACSTSRVAYRDKHATQGHDLSVGDRFAKGKRKEVVMADADDVLSALRLGWSVAEMRGRTRPDGPPGEVGGMPDHVDHPLPLRIERGTTELRIDTHSVSAEL